MASRALGAYEEGFWDLSLSSFLHEISRGKHNFALHNLQAKSERHFHSEENTELLQSRFSTSQEVTEAADLS